MGTHLYCIVPRRHLPPPGLAGLDEAPVRSVEVDRLELWYSELESAPRPTLERVQAHDEVICRATTDSVTPLPVRFGQWFPDRERLQDRIAEQAPIYVDRLELLAGALEFGVRFVSPDSQVEVPAEREARRPASSPGPDPSLLPAGAGRSHLRALAERSDVERRKARRGEELVSGLQESLGALVLHSWTQSARTTDGLAEVAHLVRRKDFHRYRERVDRYAARCTDVEVLLTGPWPPYSFGP